MRKGVYLLPNSLTLCAMFAGFYAMLSVLKGNYQPAAWAIVVAGVFDGLDGWVARLTHSSSKFGVQMDSLSDAIAFGVAPALLLYSWTLNSFGRLGVAVAFLFVACGAMRLARYNIQMDSTEKKYFTGMPIPAAAGIIASTVLFFMEMGFDPYRSKYVLVVTFVCALLMVSTLKFHSQKEFNLGKRKPFKTLVGIVLFLTLLIIFPSVTLFLTGVLYLLTGVFENLYMFLTKPSRAFVK